MTSSESSVLVNGFLQFFILMTVTTGCFAADKHFDNYSSADSKRSEMMQLIGPQFSRKPEVVKMNSRMGETYNLQLTMKWSAHVMGPYNIEYPYFEFCAGPKSRNLTHSSVDIKKNKENYMVNINFTFLVQSHLDEIKIKMFSIEKKQKTLIVSYKINDPCHHFAFAPFVEKYLHANKCTVEKGNYVIRLSLSNITRSFYGESAFYGDFQSKSIVSSKQGNILCWVLDMVISKKT